MKIFIKWKIILPTILIVLVFLPLFLRIYYGGQDCKVIPELDEYCNNPFLPEHSEEGDVPFGEFRLFSVHVVTRHGDRSPIHILDTKSIPTKSFRCYFDSKMKREFPIISEFEAKLKESSGLLKNGSLRQYGHFPSYPDSTICPRGTLTPQGSFQQIRNGLLLQSKYRKHGLFQRPGHEKNFKVVTTRYSRTFQTATSFMYGLMPDFDLSKLTFETASQSGMCREGNGLKCSCPSVQGLEHTFSCTFEQSWPTPKGDSVPDLFSRVSERFQFDPKKPNPRPSHVFDFLVTHHCHNQSVVRNCLLNDVVSHVGDHCRWAGRNGRYVDQSRLRMMPLLVEMSRKMSALSKRTASDAEAEGPAFVLYSGHDSTLGPFSAALGVGHGFWPKYSSRVVLEQYKEAMTDQSYVRILLDGRPVTAMAPFCREEEGRDGGDELMRLHSLCLLEKFVGYVDSNAKEYRTDCYRNVSIKDGEKLPDEPGISEPSDGP